MNLTVEALQAVTRRIRIFPFKRCTLFIITSLGATMVYRKDILHEILIITPNFLLKNLQFDQLFDQLWQVESTANCQSVQMPTKNRGAGTVDFAKRRVELGEALRFCSLEYLVERFGDKIRSLNQPLPDR